MSKKSTTPRAPKQQQQTATATMPPIASVLHATQSPPVHLSNKSSLVAGDQQMSGKQQHLKRSPLRAGSNAPANESTATLLKRARVQPTATSVGTGGYTGKGDPVDQASCERQVNLLANDSQVVAASSGRDNNTDNEMQQAITTKQQEPGSNMTHEANSNINIDTANQSVKAAAAADSNNLHSNSSTNKNTNIANHTTNGSSNENENIRNINEMDSNVCAACLKPIKERYLLMALDKKWHEDCLKCACCDCRLGEVGSSLYIHSDQILCRTDFLRIFGPTGLCAACKRIIQPYELVMRANEMAFHLNCFACQQCQYRFCVGDRFHLTPETHRVICVLCHSEQVGHSNQLSHPHSHPPQQQSICSGSTSLSAPESSSGGGPAAAGDSTPGAGNSANSQQRQQQQQQEQDPRQAAPDEEPADRLHHDDPSSSSSTGVQQQQQREQCAM